MTMLGLSRLVQKEATRAAGGERRAHRQERLNREEEQGHRGRWRETACDLHCHPENVLGLGLRVGGVERGRDGADEIERLGRAGRHLHRAPAGCTLLKHPC